MADNGIRSAFNVQFTTTHEGGIIVNVEVTNAATDHCRMSGLSGERVCG